MYKLMCVWMETTKPLSQLSNVVYSRFQCRIAIYVKYWLPGLLHKEITAVE
jgi:hypothetical protein